MTDTLPPQEKVHGLMINADLSQGPFYIDGMDTTPKLLRLRCQTLGDRTAHREKTFGIWRSHSWNDYFTRAKHLGLGLLSLGLQRGEVVSILSEDSKEWMYTDMGVQCVGGICSGVYTTDSASQLEYLVNNSDSRFLFVENDEQLDKFLQVRDKMPDLAKVIVMDREGLHGFTDPQIIFLDELYDLGAAYDAANPQAFDAGIDATKPEDTAILVYTSGTTGKPKGAMISHGNLMYSVAAGLRDAPTFDTDDQLCFLPLCHILERVFSVNAPIAAGSTTNFAESPETIFDNLQEVSPQTFVAVPRLWEKIYSQVAIRIGDATGLQKWAYAQALKAGGARAACLAEGKSLPFGANLAYRFWDLALLQNLRRMIGMDRLRRGGSGAAPISPELLQWYHAIGVPVLEGYGMTESSGVICINCDDTNKIGTVGRALPGAGIRISDEGEIQYKAGNVFQGYWKNPEKTAETFTEDGWLRTGDVGMLDNQGFLKITGRLKDIIITAGGKNITPAEIENKLKFSPYISDVVVIGDKRKFLTCLVMIDQENVEKFAQDRRVPFSNYASLCAAPEVQDLIRETVEEVNKDFARVEQIKDFRLIDVLLTADDDELTPTMKLKRSFVETKHAELISQMY
ncbi:AMP-binding protein [Sulfitobacter mediterraneus]|uniref:AMP-dependent synthetase/ligase n=1 Tax=Sulfitobacter mediterraneus TaxID=83219 RepID=UPI001939E940|nr:AMP-binding protein [Sulfitobacter mediterraneus]MBM1556258.1 AMP-binding protein [Sulfitobacter mediterraneus]MBM1567704.1 AMP-binding protein [Sulfitobacter mediterraneus]MBM1571612.1 AMP-binding protein [Sulfitobacter mediterraneus]MBM1575400.1 AMP-binding protein [Sulfitobacter mediterraneus]MBM1579109.1 AMP-binding protein [Sulfitobacter mediterraneus]